MPNLNTSRRINLEYAVDLTKRRLWYADEETAGDTTEAKSEAKATDDELQKRMDALAGNVRKEATAAARKALLKELGLDPEDPKAVDTVKGKLSAADEAEKAKMSAEEKALARIKELEAERDEAKTKAAEVESKRRTSLLNSEFKLLAKTTGGQFPDDVVEYARRTHAADIAALLGEDDTFDSKKAQSLIDSIKKERPNFFDTRKTVIGTGSHGGGDRGASAETDVNAARAANFKNARRDV